MDIPLAAILQYLYIGAKSFVVCCTSQAGVAETFCPFKFSAAFPKNYFKTWFATLQTCFNLLQTSLSCGSCCKLVSGCCRLALSCGNCCKLALNCCKLALKLLQTFFKLSQLLQTCFKLLQICFELWQLQQTCFKLLQTCFKLWQLLQTYSN